MRICLKRVVANRQESTFLMRRKVGIIWACLSLLLPLLYIGCNLTYKVRNQYYEIEEILYLPCGKITCDLIGKGNSRFVFRQRFDIDGPATIHLDSLKIYINNRSVQRYHNQIGNKDGITKWEVQSKEVWETSFELDRGVFEGDTIKVFGDGYVNCGNESITLDTMVYAFINSLRIHGVNQ